MKELSRTLGSMTYDGLISGLNPSIRVGGGILAKLTEAAVYPRGTILAKSAGDGKLYMLGSSAGGGDLTPEGILCDDTEVGTEEDTPVVLYLAGCFDPGKVTVAEGYTLSEADKDKLRAFQIVFKSASPEL